MGLLLVFTVGIITQIWSRSLPPYPATKEIPGSQLIPSSALAVVSVTTNPRQWQKLKQSLSADTYLPVQQALLQFHNTLLKPLGLGYESHMRSWIGAMATLVVLPMPKTYSFPSMGGVDRQTGDIVRFYPLSIGSKLRKPFDVP